MLAVTVLYVVVLDVAVAGSGVEDMTVVVGSTSHLGIRLSGNRQPRDRAVHERRVGVAQ